MFDKIHMPEQIRIVCVMCKKAFIPGKDKNGLPNGVGFVMADGRIVNVCGACIMKLGEEGGKNGKI